MLWRKLLDQRSPTWRYCSVSSQRNQKRVGYLEDSETSSGVGNERVAKKRKKGALESPRSASGSDGTLHVNDALGLRSLGGNISEIPEDMLACTDGMKGLCESQKTLHPALKPEMAKLCQVLHLSAEVTSAVEAFLEYVISGHHVCTEPTTTLQAFEVALCWVSARLLKQKINRKESLALARDHLAYGCSRRKVDYIYSMLFCLRSIFLKSQWGSRLDFLPKDSEQSVEGTSKHQVAENTSQAMLLQEKKNTEKACGTESQACLSERRGADSTRKDIDKSIKDIEKKRSKQVKKLEAKHEEEKLELARNYEKEKSDLEKSKKAKAVVLNIVWRTGSTQGKIDALTAMDRDFEKQFDQLKSQMGESLNNLEEKHEAERKKLAEYEADWIKRIERWAEELLGLMDGKCEHRSGIIPSDTSGNAPDVAETCNDPAGDASGCEERQKALDPLAKAQKRIGTTPVNNSQLDVLEIAKNGQEEIFPVTSSQQHTHDVVMESRSNGPTLSTEPEIYSAADCQEKVAASNVRLSEDQIHDGATSPAPDEDITLRVPEIPRPLENGASGDLPLNPEQAWLSVENNGASNLTPTSAAILDPRNEETCSFNQESSVESALPLEHPVPAAESGGSAIPDQFAQDMHPPSSSLPGTQHDPATNTESQNIEEAAEPSAAEPNTCEVEAAEPSTAEPDTHGVEAAEHSTAEPETREVEAAEHSTAEPDTCEVEAAEPSVAEPDTHEVEVAEPSVAEPDTHELEVTESLHHSSNGDVVSQNAETSLHHAENVVEIAQEDVVVPSAGVARDQPATSQCRSMTNHIPQGAGQAPLPMPCTLLGDPFQCELEKIHREVETATKIHEDTKSQLNAEFERKMAELQREYDTKYREADAKLQARAKELEAYKNLLVMSKYLADAFKIKCSDPHAASAPATSRDISSDTIQRRSSVAPSRPSVISTAHPPSQPTVPTVPHPSVPPPQSQLIVPPIPPVPRPSVPTPQSQSTVPPVPRPLVPLPQSRSTVSPMPRSSVPPQGPSSMPQSRPPVITNTSVSPVAATPPPLYNSRVRAPAPHLQSYRSSPVAAAANNVQRAPSSAPQNSLPARVPRPEAGEGPKTALKRPVSAAATYSVMLIQQQQQQQEQGGNSTVALQSKGDVVCLSDDE